MNKIVSPSAFKRLGAFSCCLMLATLFAPSAQAIEIAADPGDVGQPASFIFFQTFDPPTVIDITFTDQKTLEGAGTVAFNLNTDAPFINFTGFFSDAAGDEISGTSFVGSTAGDTKFDLPGFTVWHDIHFEGDFRGTEAYTLTWSDLLQATKPTVGVVPEPGTALLMGLGLAGLGVFGRSRRDDSETTA
jgi:hypothetical protein